MKTETDNPDGTKQCSRRSSKYNEEDGVDTHIHTHIHTQWDVFMEDQFLNEIMEWF